MFHVKVYNDAKSAYQDMKTWLREKFPEGRFSADAGPFEGGDDIYSTPQLISQMQSVFKELDKLDGICSCRLYEIDGKSIRAFAFGKKLTRAEAALYQKLQQQQEDFEEAGGERLLHIKDKAEYLRKHAPTALNGCGNMDGIKYEANPESYQKAGFDFIKKDFSNLDARRECIHCGSVFQIQDYKVVAGADMDFIVCPHYPHCDGNIMDWMPTAKPVQVHPRIVSAQAKDAGSGESEEVSYVKLAETILPAREGFAICYNDKPQKDGDAVMIVLKRSMYENTKEHVDYILKSYEDGCEYDLARMLNPSIIIEERRSIAADFMCDFIEEECGFDEETIDKVRKLDRDVLLQLETQKEQDVENLNYDKSVANTRERVNRLFGKGNEGHSFTSIIPERPVLPRAKIFGATLLNDRAKLGRNDPCICNSGKKFKNCCME